jgi:hypothetical protein
MRRAAHEAQEDATGTRRTTFRRARFVIVPAALLVAGLGFEIAGTVTWLFTR